MAGFSEDYADSSQGLSFTPTSTPQKASWRDDYPMSDDNCRPYTPPLSQHLSFTPTSTLQKSTGDSSADESLSESEFELKDTSQICRRLTFDADEAACGPSSKGITR